MHRPLYIGSNIPQRQLSDRLRTAWGLTGIKEFGRTVEEVPLQAPGLVQELPESPSFPYSPELNASAGIPELLSFPCCRNFVCRPTGLVLRDPGCPILRLHRTCSWPTTSLPGGRCPVFIGSESRPLRRTNLHTRWANARASVGARGLPLPRRSRLGRHVGRGCWCHTPRADASTGRGGGSRRAMTAGSGSDLSGAPRRLTGPDIGPAAAAELTTLSPRGPAAVASSYERPLSAPPQTNFATLIAATGEAA